MLFCSSDLFSFSCLKLVYEVFCTHQGDEIKYLGSTVKSHGLSFKNLINILRTFKIYPQLKRSFYFLITFWSDQGLHLTSYNLWFLHFFMLSFSSTEQHRGQT